MFFKFGVRLRLLLVEKFNFSVLCCFDFLVLLGYVERFFVWKGLCFSLVGVSIWLKMIFFRVVFINNFEVSFLRLMLILFEFCVYLCDYFRVKFCNKLY